MNIKQSLLAEFAALARALGHPHRLALIEALAQGDWSVEDLAARTGLSLANASQHLQRLKAAGVVSARRDGKHVRYHLSHDCVVDLFNALQRTAAQRSAEIDRIVHSYFNARDSMEPISRRELTERCANGAVTLLDVRPAEEFEKGRLPSARNIPLEQLEKRLLELPEDQEIVAYCRGAYCVLAFEAVALLRAKGRQARRLEDGFPEWKAAGLPVEV